MYMYTEICVYYIKRAYHNDWCWVCRSINAPNVSTNVGKLISLYTVVNEETIKVCHGAWECFSVDRWLCILVPLNLVFTFLLVSLLAFDRRG